MTIVDRTLPAGVDPAAVTPDALAELERIRATNSDENNRAVIDGCRAAGIVATDADIKRDVLTYNAWRKLGRQVIKGQKAIARITVMRRGKGGKLYPKSCAVFHTSQTMSARPSREPDPTPTPQPEPSASTTPPDLVGWMVDELSAAFDPDERGAVANVYPASLVGPIADELGACFPGDGHSACDAPMTGARYVCADLTGRPCDVATYAAMINVGGRGVIAIDGATPWNIANASDLMVEAHPIPDDIIADAATLLIITRLSEPEPDPEPDRGDPATADRLDALADGMQRDIDRGRASRRENTRKQRRQAGHARVQADQDEHAQRALRVLANGHRLGTLPPELVGIRSKKLARELTRRRLDYDNATGYYDVAYPTDELESDDPRAEILRAFVGEPEPSGGLDTKTRNEIAASLHWNVPGFFPTPPDLADRLVRLADPQPGDIVLEPSAGRGDILDAIVRNNPAQPTIWCELDQRLAGLTQRKGHGSPSGADFLKTEIAADRVIMNPPFEKLQDIDHVRHAYDNMNAGGRLVAIVSPGALHRQTRKATEFQGWLTELSADTYDLASGTFASSGTGVRAHIIVIDKP